MDASCRERRVLFDDGQWSFLDVETDAILLFAWSHPELGSPDECCFWESALEAELWWKYFDLPSTGLWVRRTTHQVYEKWLSMCHLALFEALPAFRRDWWSEARLRAQKRILPTSSLRAIIQYHELIVYRKDDTVYEKMPKPRRTNALASQEAYFSLEKSGIPTLPTEFIKAIYHRHQYVKNAISHIFDVVLLDLVQEGSEKMENVLSLAWQPLSPDKTQKTLQRASIKAIESSKGAFRVIFDPHVNGEAQEVQSWSIDMDEAEMAKIVEKKVCGLEEGVSWRGEGEGGPVLSGVGSLASVGAIPSSQSSPASTRMAFKTSMVRAMTRRPAFEEKVAQVKKFFSDLAVPPLVAHLLYCTAATSGQDKNTREQKMRDLEGMVQQYALEMSSNMDAEDHHDDGDDDGDDDASNGNSNGNGGATRDGSMTGIEEEAFFGGDLEYFER